MARHSLIRLCLSSGLTCILAAVLFLAVPVAAQDETAEPPADTETGVYAPDEAPQIEPTGNNSYCTLCHSQPQRVSTFGDGTQINLFVIPDMIANSVHGPAEDHPGLGCIDCHGENAFPHSGPTPFSGRSYTIDTNALCASCHEEPAQELNEGLHAIAINEGNLEAAVCTDCHTAHSVQSAENNQQLVAETCGDCHEGTLVEWRMSPHSDLGPLGCATCHSYHEQTLRIGETSTDMCMNCHEPLPEIFVHNTHPVENVQCVDCHMYVPEGQAAESLPIALRGTGHSMALDATPCTTCHQDLEASGEWDQIVSNRESGEVEQAAVTGSEVNGEAEDGANSAIAVIQGLLVGLGLGVTFAIIFLNRRRPTSS